MLKRIVSGGQTGVDRGALDAALALGFPCGGWCPRGRRAEDGRIPDVYPLTENESSRYIRRTRRNVDESDGTLIVTRGMPTGGTAATAAHATRAGRPCFVADLDRAPGTAAAPEIRAWIAANGIEVLNVAGPRASAFPGIADAARDLVAALLTPPPPS
jgi:hypothetical protein